MATITWLGTGSAFNAKDGNTASLVEFGPYKILLDCGFGVPHELKRLGLINDITHIFISHLHSDHAGGLELLAQWRYFVAQRQGVAVPTLCVPPEILERLRLNEQLGLGSIQDEFGRPLTATLETYFDVSSDRGGHHFCDGNEALHVWYETVSHVPGTTFPSYGFELRLARDHKLEQIVFLTADTRDAHRPTRRVPLSGYGDKLDLIFHDCQLFESGCCGAGDVHASLDKLIREIAPEDRSTVWLVHYGENWRDFAAQAKEAGFAGFVQKGQRFDLWTGEDISLLAVPTDR